MKRILSDFRENTTASEKAEITQKIFDKVISLSEYKKASLVFAYIPDILEADCMPVIKDALLKGKKVCVPKVDFESMKTGENKMDFYLLDSSKSIDEQLKTGAYGIREPKSELQKVREKAVQKESAPFMIVPGVAFTQSGKRLGHGKGFYDIYIQRLKKSGIKPFLCAIALKCQITDDLPAEEHDILMDTVIF
ncbi:5-formyltetrahydrofolate cyclo-ligase [Treponema sp.]|uniref:5-formyltetrahydrofolate cyclo-ligase n=1 Tax=Treponema sp. TaxID=166 RepID=UPI003890F317